MLLNSKTCVRFGLMNGCEVIVEGLKLARGEELPDVEGSGTPMLLRYMPEGLLLRAVGAEWMLPPSDLPPLPYGFDCKGLFVLLPESVWFTIDLGGHNEVCQKIYFMVSGKNVLGMEIRLACFGEKTG